MPYPYTLPTTSTLLLSTHFSSSTHPSLPLTATTHRSILKDALKKHKRLPPSSQPAHLPALLNALTAYLPYLLALTNPTSHNITLTTLSEAQTAWRSTLSSTLPGRDPPRPSHAGLHYDLAFTLSTLATTHTLLARSALPDHAQAIKHLLLAHAIHTYSLSPTLSISRPQSWPIDLHPSLISAQASLALAEATLLVVAKDDPYILAVSTARDEKNTDWMFTAPKIPKVRAHLFARICLAGAEHAGAAHGLLVAAGGAVDEGLTRYASEVGRVGRARGKRWLGVDAEVSGRTGEGIAWIRSAKSELGIVDTETKGVRGLKLQWREKREERKVEKGADWGLDAGRAEEARVLAMLETNWERENAVVGSQVVPGTVPAMPSGREYHSPLQAWVPPSLDAEALVRMRVAVQPGEGGFGGEEEDSGDEGVGNGRAEPVGAFPGTGAEYGRSGTSASYY